MITLLISIVTRLISADLIAHVIAELVRLGASKLKDEHLKAIADSVADAIEGKKVDASK